MSTGPSTVLLAEGNDQLRTFLCEQLRPDYRVREAAGTDEARRQVREDAPDLLVASAGLPGRGGIPLCSWVTERTDGASLPTILLVGGAEAAPEAPGPTDATLKKPFSAEELRRAVRRHLPPQELLDGPADDAFLRKVVRTIEKRLHDPGFRTRELAEALALSRRHLTRRLKEKLDRTPAALIRERRLARAQALLEDNPDTIREVSEAVGFRSPSHFSQVFREATGQTPSAYRQRHA
jgi:AraC-like DNA-binding protein